MPLRIRTVGDLEALLTRRGLAPRPHRLVLDCDELFGARFAARAG